MKMWDIAIKDLVRSFRSTFAVGMMFVIPLLIPGLIFVAFGGSLGGGSEQEYTLPVVAVQVVNLDQGDEASGINAGKLLVEALSGERLAELFSVSETADEAAARAAVDRQEAAAALLIPVNFTRAALAGEAEGVITLYRDPALTFGPSLLKEVVDQFLDGFSGGRIAGLLLEEQFAAAGLAPAPAVTGQAVAAYGAWLQSLNGENGQPLPVVVRNPAAQQETDQTSQDPSMMGSILAGMMIFFVFFGATLTAQTIIKEQEEGTLARIFTTPTPLTTILGGKFAAVFLIIVVQAVVLVTVSALIFGVRWGNPLSLILMIVGLVAVAAGFGILLMALVKSTRQAGPVTGAVLTFTGMAGGLMSQGMPDVPQAMNTLSLAMPQGWAMRGFRLVLSGAQPSEVLLPLAIMLGLGIVFFALGARLFRTRFA